MRSIALLALLSVAVIATAQAKLPTLGSPSPVDFHVTSLDWHPTGDAMVYTRKEGTGKGVGIYMPGQDQGRVLIHLDKGDRVETHWLPGAKQALAIVYRKEVEANVPQTRIQVHLLNAEMQDGRMIFNRPLPDSQNPHMTVDTSPKLLHAIFRLNTGEAKKPMVSKHFVMKTGTQELTPSPDLDAAAEKGWSGPSWSIDGTAVYAAGSAPNSRLVTPGEVITVDGGQLIGTTNVSGASGATASTAVIELAIRDVEALTLSRTKSESLSGLTFRITSARAAAPPTGATVMELMPQSAILRQVKFRGSWVDAPFATSPIASQDHPIIVEFGRSKGQSKTIWLTSANKGAETGVLVSSNASQAWISPKSDIVAYLTDGALFIRTIKQ